TKSGAIRNYEKSTACFAAGVAPRVLLRQLEVEADLGLRFDGLVVEHRGFVTPLAVGLEGGVGQKRRAADNAHRAGASLPVNGGCKDNGAGEFDGAGACRILRFHSVDDLAGNGATGDALRSDKARLSRLNGQRQ